jgi:tRNA threonylcarbamoyladenosine biosynthesis protein TsaB
VDTSTSVVGIAIVEDDQLIVEYTLNLHEMHSAKLLSSINDAMNRAEMKIFDIDGFAVSIGPGSFTGLRVGIATVKGLSYATQKPMLAVPTLEALAHTLRYSDRLICPLLDARKNEVYGAIYSGGGKIERKSDYLCVKIEQIINMIDQLTIFLGEGAHRYKAEIISGLGDKAIIADQLMSLPRGANVAILGLEKLRRNEVEDAFSLKPLYVRKPEAEVKFELGALGKKAII